MEQLGSSAVRGSGRGHPPMDLAIGSTGGFGGPTEVKIVVSRVADRPAALAVLQVGNGLGFGFLGHTIAAVEVRRTVAGRKAEAQPQYGVAFVRRKKVRVRRVGTRRR